MSVPSLSSAIHNIQISLYETPSTPSHSLFSAAALLSRPDYADVVTERSISDLCGYPCCHNPLPSSAAPANPRRYRISLREHKVFDLEETYKFCSDRCLIDSTAFAETLGETRRADVDVGKRKIEEVMRVFGFGSDEDRESGGGSRICRKLEIMEKGVDEGEVKAEEWIGPANAIEGYVPRATGGSKSLSDFESDEGTYTSTIIAGDKLDMGLAERHSVTTKDDSETKLHNVASNETQRRANKIISKASKPKRRPKATNKMSDKVDCNSIDFKSSIIYDDNIGPPFPSTCLVANHGVSELITKQLENVSIAEKRATNKSTDEANFNSMDFSSSIIYGDEIGPTFPDTCLVATQDASELITKQLENVSIAEKKGAVRKPLLKSARPKSRKNTDYSKTNQMDFENTIVNENNVNVVASPSGSLQATSKQSTKSSEDDNHIGNKASTGTCQSDDILYSESKALPEGYELTKLDYGVDSKKKAVSQANVLKSSLKTSRSKVVRNWSVKWADERDNELLEDKRDVLPTVHEEDPDTLSRFVAAEACAAALTQAAQAVVSGEFDAGDAVTEAGIVILPQQQCGSEESEANDNALEFDRGVLKWPKKTVLLDTDMFDVEDSWHDAPPEGFHLSLSIFATMWMSLFGWITCSSLAYIYGHEESSQDEFLLVNGREYPRKIYMVDGKSSEIKLALSGFISRALPGLAMDLKLSTPVSTLEKFVGRFLDTMSFVDAVPSFRIKQWQVVALLFIEALSVNRLPSLASYITDKNVMLHKVLNAAKISNDEYETMRDLIMPLGRLPQFSMQRGG